MIAVDGYNFIKQSPELRRLEEIELRKAREGLVAALSRYKRFKGHEIWVVFDGRQEGSGAGRRERVRGIEMIFSKPGEKADDVLKRLAAERREGVAVVTSDNDVASFAAKKGSPILSVGQFAEHMALAEWSDLKGGPEERETPGPGGDRAKKGPSRRLAKSRRKTLAARKKM